MSDSGDTIKTYTDVKYDTDSDKYTELEQITKRKVALENLIAEDKKKKDIEENYTIIRPFYNIYNITQQEIDKNVNNEILFSVNNNTIFETNTIYEGIITNIKSYYIYNNELNRKEDFINITIKCNNKNYNFNLKDTNVSDITFYEITGSNKYVKIEKQRLIEYQEEEKLNQATLNARKAIEYAQYYKNRKNETAINRKNTPNKFEEGTNLDKKSMYLTKQYKIMMTDGKSFTPTTTFFYNSDIPYNTLHQLPYKDVLNKVRYVSGEIVGYKLMTEIPGNQ